MANDDLPTEPEVINNNPVEYETRDIVNIHGAVIGQLSLTNTTSETEWAARLAVFSSSPSNPTIQQIVKGKILSAMDFGKQLMLEFATENVLLGLSTEQVSNLVIKLNSVQSMLLSGSLYTALAALEVIEPDAVLTQSRINNYSSKIKQYLGL